MVWRRPRLSNRYGRWWEIKRPILNWGKMTATLTTQIKIDSGSVAWLAGKQIKVVEIVLDKLAHG